MDTKNKKLDQPMRRRQVGELWGEWRWINFGGRGRKEVAVIVVAGPAGRAYASGMAQLLESRALDWTDCSLVEINPRKMSGAPILRGTRMPVDAILENYTDGLSTEEIADVFELPADSVRALLAYAAEHQPAFRQ